jgi:hypothetical protein
VKKSQYLRYVKFFLKLRSETMNTNKLIYLAVLACGMLGSSAMAADTAPPSVAQAPVAKKATDRRSEHYRLREACVQQAQTNGLAGEDYKVAVQLCMQGK